MAKKKTSMPTSHAGITSSADELNSKYHLEPSVVIFMIAVVVLIVAAMHYFKPGM